MPNSFQVNNAGPGSVVIAKATPGQRYRVTYFGLTFQDTNGVQFYSGLNGSTISGLLVGVAGQVLTPAAVQGFGKGFQTDKGAPLVLYITGSGTITGEIAYDLLQPNA